MAKFVIALAFIFGGCGLYVLVQRDWRALRALISPVGWLIFLALALPWPIAIYHRFPGIVGGWIFDNVDRFAGELNHDKRNAFYYLYIIPAIVMPWTLWLVPGAVAGAKQGLWRQKTWRFLACWVLAGLTLLSMSAFKHKHYAIPILPPLSIIAGWFLANWVGRPGSFRMPALPAVAAIVLGAAAGVAVLWVRHMPFAREATVIAVLGAAALAVFAVAHAANKPTAALAGLFATIWIGAVGVQTTIIDHFDSYRGSAEFARRVAGRVPAAARLHLAGVDTVQELYYLPLPMTRYEKLAGFHSVVRQAGGGEYYVITPCGNVPALQQLGTFAEVERFYRPKSASDTAPPANSPDLRVFGILTVPAQATSSSSPQGRGPG
jgi:4-amino-4-deoxy-L-arabinose transferase-like glycosyltransferase